MIIGLWPIIIPGGAVCNRRVEVLLLKLEHRYKNLGELYEEIQYGTDTDEGQE